MKELLKQYLEEVKNYKMIDKIENILSYETVKAMPFHKARQYLIDIKSKYSVNAIAKHWNQLSTDENFYNAKMYKIFHDFDVPVRSEKMAKAHEIRSQMAEAGQLKHSIKNNPTIIAEASNLQIFDPYLTEPKEQIDPSVETPKEPFKQYKAVEISIPGKKKSNFTINLDGELTGKELAEKIEAICKLLSNDKNYNVIFGVEEAGE